MERKFRAREVGKSEYTSRGCTVFVEIQENDVAIVIDNFRMEFAPHFTTAGCVLFCVMYAKLEKNKTCYLRTCVIQGVAVVLNIQSIR